MEGDNLDENFKIETQVIDAFVSIKIEAWYKYLNNKASYFSYYQKTNKLIKSYLNKHKNIQTQTLFVDLSMHQEAGFVPETPSYMTLDVLFKPVNPTEDFENLITKEVVNLLHSRKNFQFCRNKKF